MPIVIMGSNSLTLLIVTHINFRQCHVHFYAFVKQAFSKQLYVNTVPRSAMVFEHAYRKQPLLCRPEIPIYDG